MEMKRKDFEYLIGSKVEILNMEGEPQYTGKRGVVEYVDDLPSLHGTWGGCAILPDRDMFKVLSRKDGKNS